MITKLSHRLDSSSFASVGLGDPNHLIARVVLVLLTVSSDHLFSEDEQHLRLICGSIIYKYKLYLVRAPLALLEEVDSVVHAAREALLLIVTGEYDSDVISRLLF